MSTERTNYTTGSPWESKVGYSRAVKIGPVLEISGTTSVREGEILHKSDAYRQALEIILIAQEVLEVAGASLADVIRTRMYVTKIADWEAVGKAHSEAFSDINPATTLVEVSNFVNPDMLVEIEFTAYLTD